MRRLFLIFFVLYSGILCAQEWRIYYDSTELYWLKDWPKSIALLQRAERSAVQDLGIYDPNYLTIINDLGLAHWNARHLPEARELLTRALQIKSEVYNETDAEYLRSVLNLAALSVEDHDYEEAGKYYQRILHIADENDIADDILFEAVKNLVAIYELEHQSDEALTKLDIYESKYRFLERSDKFYAPLLLIKGRLARQRRDFNTSERILTDLIAHIATHQVDRMTQIGAYQEFGIYYRHEGNYSLAERYLLKAYDLLSAGDGSVVAEVQNNLAAIYIELGRYEQALSFYQKSLERCHLQLGNNSIECTAIKNNIALTYTIIGDYEEAITLYQEVLQQYSQMLNAGDELYVNSMNNLGTAYRKQGALEEAAEQYVKALEIEKDVKRNNTDLHAALLNNLALVKTKTKDFELAKQYYEESLALKRSVYPTSSIKLKDVLNNLGLVLWELEEYERAEEYLIRAMEMTERQIKYVFPGLSENEQVDFYNKQKFEFERFNTIAVDRAQENPELLKKMFNNQILLKGLLFNSENRRYSQVVSSGDSALIKRFDLMRQYREELATYYQMTKVEQLNYEAPIQELEQGVEQLNKEIALATSLGDIEINADWATLQASLDTTVAVVDIIRFRKFDKSSSTYIKGGNEFEYGFTDSVYYAALVTTAETTTHPQLVLFPDGNFMESRAYFYYKNAVRFDVSDSNSYKFYWEPLMPHLGNKRDIYIANDGIYQKINPGMFKNPSSGRYLLQDYQLHTILNPSQLLYHRQDTTQRSKEVVLMGDPNFDVDLSQRSALRSVELSDFYQLPETRVEVSEIEKMLKAANWQPRTYLYTAANEDNLKSLQSPAILHLATHGYFSDDIISINQNARRNLLFHSGLLLSGANKNSRSDAAQLINDGIVTAYEVKNLNLQNTDLVVLSACETGLGKIEYGEGVYGLQRSFLTAGASNVIMSLWKVDDTSTKELMVVFYKNLLQGMEKGPALREAQLTMMRKFKNPRLWGGFVLVSKN